MAKKKRKTDQGNRMQGAGKTAHGVQSNRPKKSGSPKKADKAPQGRSRGGSPARQTAQPMSAEERKRDYIFSMSHTPRLDENASMHWIQFIPAALFAAVAILIVRQYWYLRDMSVYYWSSEAAPPSPGQPNLTEFFSHYKTELIGWSVLLMGVMLAYRIIVQQFAIKRSALYWPMLGYLLFVLLSFIFSDNRDVAWDGWNDRFEGTAMILCYYAGVFFVMNSVNSERNIKFIVYPIAAASVILSAIGISQATGHDFFQSVLGQKLIVPNEMTKEGSMTWDLIDQAAARGEQYLKFTFQNNEVYQTVYNINYVSFYLTLLIPLFAMMFIWAKGLVRKSIWGAILGLVIFNFFGSASSGGMLGMAVVIVLVAILLRKKLLQWWRPVLIIVAIVAAVGAADVALVEHNGKGVKWTDELKSAVGGALTAARTPEPQSAKGPGNVEGAQDTPVSAAGADVSEGAAAAVGTAGAAEATGPLAHLDYFSTEDNTLTFSVDGNKAVLTATSNGALSVVDDQGEQLGVAQDESTKEVLIDDSRFANIFFLATQDDNENHYLEFNIRGDSTRKWPFTLTGADKATLMYRNDLGKNVSLVDVPHLGFKDDLSFGSGRGYIWSASLPMIKNTILIGYGADTYCINYPHRDYVGKYNAGWNINMIVDKPHNIYIATAINTGLISLIALLALFGMYMVQSFRLYWRREFTTFADYAGAGIFFGVSGFVISGVVDDSTVSVMPMFYALLATGIATNIMLKKRLGAVTAARSDGKNAGKGEGTD